MAFEYIGALLEEAVQSTASVEVRGRVEQVVGTIIRAVVPGVKVGELMHPAEPVGRLDAPGRGRGLREAGGPVDAARRFAGHFARNRSHPDGGNPFRARGRRSPRARPERARRSHRRRAAAQAPDPLSGLRRSPEPHAPQDHRQADFSGPARARRGAYLRRGAAHGYFRGGWRR